ncbi:MAG TPA: DUF1684 domain-containing protein [Rhizomicrobium sp.]|jgi:hypothetical protein
MRIVLALAAAALSIAAATPEQAFKASLIDDNKAWAQTPHAILKIQDAAYLGEGQSSSLIGAKGKPSSYHWGPTPKDMGAGVLTALVKNGHPVIVKDGKTYSDAEIAKGILIDTDIDVSGAQTQVNAGVIGARFMIFNQKNPDALSFKGVDYYPYNPAYIITATFTPDPKLPPHAFKTSRGTTKQFFHAGDATFALNGKTMTLPFYTSDQGKIASLAAFFTDGLTGKETYGAGRYVDIDVKAYPPKSFQIDFNYAYNPNCARSRFFTCPVAIDNLDTEVRAGEKDPHKAHAQGA